MEYKKEIGNSKYKTQEGVLYVHIYCMQRVWNEGDSSTEKSLFPILQVTLSDKNSTFQLSHSLSHTQWDMGRPGFDVGTIISVPGERQIEKAEQRIALKGVQKYTSWCVCGLQTDSNDGGRHTQTQIMTQLPVITFKVKVCNGISFFHLMEPIQHAYIQLSHSKTL